MQRRGGSTLTDTRAVVASVVRGYRRRLALMSTLAFVGGLAEAIFLVLATRAAFAITDRNERIGIIAGRYLSVSHALLLGAAVVVVRVVLAIAANAMSARVAADVVARTRMRLARSFLHASWPSQDQQRTGSLQELVSGFAGQASNLMGGVNQALVSIANLVALLGLAIAVDPIGAAVLVVSVGLFGSLLRPIRNAVRRRAQRNTEASMSVASTVSNVSNLGMEVNTFHVQDAVLSRLEAVVNVSRDRMRELQFARGLTTPAYVGLAYLVLIGALSFVAAIDVTNLTSLGASMLVMLRSLSYGQAVQHSYVLISSSTPPMEELERELHRLQTGRRREGEKHLDSVSKIIASGVSFSYVADTPVLHGLTFEIGPREVVGVVGPSGGGKSTLVQLLLGLREPDDGALLVDGVDLRTIERSSWARLVTFVPQEPHMIDGTIEENIRFFRSDISPGDVEHAARMAHVHDEIVQHPEGYQRTIGGAAGHLSGGQTQRLCIARALVETPDVLILDEPTSALDVRSEHLIRQTMDQLRDRMTIVVIAHRLSTVHTCDRIMVIQEGRLVAFDEPQRLEVASDFYRDALRLSGM